MIVLLYFLLAAIAPALPNFLDREAAATCSVTEDIFLLGNSLLPICSGLPKQSFRSWRFSDPQLTRNFPIDTERRNYVRQVARCLFSSVLPTPLRFPPRLVLISSGALDLLDIRGDNVKADDDFLQVVSGNRVVAGSQPLAHRYGGHQVLLVPVLCTQFLNSYHYSLLHSSN